MLRIPTRLYTPQPASLRSPKVKATACSTPPLRRYAQWAEPDRLTKTRPRRRDWHSKASGVASCVFSTAPAPPEPPLGSSCLHAWRGDAVLRPPGHALLVQRGQIFP